MTQMENYMSSCSRCVELDELADQWLSERKDRKRKTMNFLLYMYHQDEEDFLELLDALEMIYECGFALATYTDMKDTDRKIIELNLQLYIDDIKEFYKTYTAVKKLSDERPESITNAVKILLRFYNAIQMKMDGERILFTDTIWNMFEIIGKR